MAIGPGTLGACTLVATSGIHGLAFSYLGQPIALWAWFDSFPHTLHMGWQAPHEVGLTNRYTLPYPTEYHPGYFTVRVAHSPDLGPTEEHTRRMITGDTAPRLPDPEVVFILERLYQLGLVSRRTPPNEHTPLATEPAAFFELLPEGLTNPDVANHPRSIDLAN